MKTFLNIVKINQWNNRIHPHHCLTENVCGCENYQLAIGIYAYMASIKATNK